jgi:hypothetical protein
MAPLITKLTETQVAKLAEHRERWLKIGLSTEPTNREAAEVAVGEAYRAAGLEPPKIVVWLGSPMAGAVGAAMLASLQQAGQGRQVWDQVRDPVWDQVRDQVRDQVGDQVGAQVYQAGYGLHDANWLAFFEYFADACELNSARRLKGLNDIAQAAGWWWPFRGAVILTERPVWLARDDRNRLHCEDRAAIEYSDGWGVHAWHGVRVPRDIIMEPEKITPARIDKEPNAEIRRVMVERFGADRYLTESGATVIHSDEFGELVRKDIPNDEPIVMVRLTNSTEEPDGTRKRYMLRVHPELRPLLEDGQLGEVQAPTARNAVASTFGLRGDEYAPLIET